MSRFDLAAARQAASAALGRTAETTLAKLEAAGLVVVRRSDLPDPEGQVEVLRDVTLVIPDDWQPPYACSLVTSAGVTLELCAVQDAVAGAREEQLVRHVMGRQIHAEVDREEGLLRLAWRTE